LDEFFPIAADAKNAFTHYVRTMYFPLLELREENILSLDLRAAGVITEADDMSVFPNGIADLSLLHRQPQDQREAAQKAILLKVRASATTSEARRVMRRSSPGGRLL
jgi:hypothetical protein